MYKTYMEVATLKYSNMNKSIRL